MNTTRIHRRRHAFTLVEILVVIGIIVVLAGILVPLVGRSMRQAKQIRTAADLQSIATALEAFKADHGDYPRTMPNSISSGIGVLGRFLFGPFGDGVTNTSAFDNQDPPVFSAKTYLPGEVVRVGSQVTDPTWVAVRETTSGPPPTPPTPTQPSDWAPLAANDGVDGPGISMIDGGKKYGPYLQAEKFKLRGLAVLDANDNPILYFPASPAKINLLAPGTASNGLYVNRVEAPNPNVTTPSKARIKYDADDNFESFRRAGEAGDHINPLHRMRAMLGDHDGDGIIETAAGEKINTEAPYLLWAAGTDGKFGPDADMMAPEAILDVKDADRCDDVTNFKQ